ncbi:MAG: methionyl-tRNA formyltransferase [Epsilonproteobacteria bacterium]|nr:methionyl-tRNA formyltransferase [Campylobacterota bacterium]MBD3839336.1 methionyl-tRNA formyltransferase [Campylobacterota bacterium]
MKMKRIVYMGTPEYAKVILDSIINDDRFEVVLVLTQPDKKIGRKQILTPPPVKTLANLHNIEVLQPTTLRDDGIYEAIVEAKPDFIIVAAFGQLLPKNILDIAPCINLHASLLPQYRGASPIQQSLLNGDRYTGVTAMMMEEGLDSGDILAYRYFEIPFEMSRLALQELLSHEASKLILEVMDRFELIAPLAQITTRSTHCKKIKKEMGEIEFIDALEIYNKYRAFEEWPMIFNSEGTKFLDISVEEQQSDNVGEILAIDKKGVLIGCAKGSIRVKSLQPASKKPTEAKAYCISKGLKVGDSFI